MIHQFIFASPKPGMTEQEFQDYWVNVHAVKYASKIKQIKKYKVDTRVVLPGETDDPIWGGIAEIWLNNEKEELESLQSPEFIRGAKLDEPNWAAFWNTLALDTNAHEIMGGDDSVGPEAVKLVILLKRKEGMKLDDFRAYNLDNHAKLDCNLPGLKRYMQCHVGDSSYVLGESRFDSIAMLWFDNIESVQKMQASAEYQEAENDLKTFVEEKYIFPMLVEEHWIIGPEARP